MIRRGGLIQDNIGLTDSLLSRFDLLVVVLDQLDPDTNQPGSYIYAGVWLWEIINLDGDNNDEDSDAEEMGMDDRGKG